MSVAPSVVVLKCWYGNSCMVVSSRGEAEPETQILVHKDTKGAGKMKKRLNYLCIYSRNSEDQKRHEAEHKGNKKCARWKGTEFLMSLQGTCLKVNSALMVYGKSEWNEENMLGSRDAEWQRTNWLQDIDCTWKHGHRDIRTLLSKVIRTKGKPGTQSTV